MKLRRAGTLLYLPTLYLILLPAHKYVYPLLPLCNIPSNIYTKYALYPHRPYALIHKEM
jgi:hypothetical protein